MSSRISRGAHEPVAPACDRDTAPAVPALLLLPAVGALVFLSLASLLGGGRPPRAALDGGVFPSPERPGATARTVQPAGRGAPPRAAVRTASASAAGADRGGARREPGAAGPPPARGRVVVELAVVDGSGAPAGVRVQALPLAGGLAVDCTPGAPVSLPEGRHRLLVDEHSVPRGYLAPLAQERPRRAGPVGVGATDVEVSAGRTTRARLWLLRAGEVRGRVVDCGGAGVPDVEVRVAVADAAADAAAGGAAGGLPFAAVVFTDAAGAFRVEAPAVGGGTALEVRATLALPRGPDGERLPLAAHPLAHATLPGARRVTLEPDAAVDLVLALRCAGPDVRGRVVDEAGAPLAGLLVHATPAPDPGDPRAGSAADVLRQARSDADGCFALADLPPGPVRLRPAEPGAPLGDRPGGLLLGWAPAVVVDLTRGEDVDGLVLTAVRRKPCRLRGRAVGAARALLCAGEPGARGELRLLLREHRSTRDRRVDEALAVPIAADGTFALDFEWGVELPAELQLRDARGAVVSAVLVDLRRGVTELFELLR